MQTGAVLTIMRDGNQILVDGGRQGTCTATVSSSEFGTAMEEFYNNVDTFRRDIVAAYEDNQAEDRLDTLNENAARAVEQLRSAGRGLLMRFFGLDNAARLPDIFAACRRDTAPDGAPLIEVAGPSAEVLPVEILPMIDFSETPINSISALHRVLRGFPAYAARVHRLVLDDHRFIPVSVPLQTVDALHVKILRHAGLRATKLECQFFDHAAFTRCGPWPSGTTAKSNPPLKRHLASGILYPGQDFDGNSAESKAQVLHLACHYIQKTLSFELEADDGFQCSITLPELRSHFVDLTRSKFPGQQPAPDGEATPSLPTVLLGQQPAPDGETTPSLPTEPIRPLVFMNACNSSTLREEDSPLKLFLELPNNRGFIGAETELPDSFAAPFAIAVYERLLLRLQPLSVALLGARWDLLQRCQNPLGILYTAYADPDLRTDANVKL
jgi:hypothetical protein